MNITRAEIRKILLKGGRYDLSDPSDVRKLDRYVIGFEKWVQSEVAYMLSGEPLQLHPKELIEGLGWSNSNMAKKNEKDILEALRRRGAIKLSGSESLRMAIAFAKQVCLLWCWKPFFVQASNLITHDFSDGLSDGPRSVLIIDVSHDTEHGKMFVEVQSKIVSLLKAHLGATIIITDNDDFGMVDRQVTSILKPRLRLKVVRKT